jgi:signal transduction histidine kinase
VLHSGAGSLRRRLFRVPWSSQDVFRSECVIAIARGVLSSSVLLVLWLDPTEPAIYARLAYSLLCIYTVFAAIVLVCMRTSVSTGLRVPAILLACDLGFAIGLTLLTRGPDSPFFPFLILVILSAADRWGSRETLVTTATVVGALVVEALAFGIGRVDLNGPIVRVAYVLIAGLTLAWLAEKEKQRRQEAWTLASIVGQSHGADRSAGTLEAVLGNVLRAFGADRTLVVLKETSTGQVFLWDAACVFGARDAVIVSSEFDDQRRGSYLFDVPGQSWHAIRFRAGDWFDLLALDALGTRLPTGPFTLPPSFLARYPCRSVLGVSVAFGSEWTGRLLLIDPEVRADREGALRLAHRLAREVGPAAHQSYLIGTLQARAASLERGRIARELHDGIVQSLIAAEMQVDVVRRRSVADAPQMTDSLTHLQALLRGETRGLRELTHRLQATEPSPRPLAGLTDLVAQFERDTGIQARFSSDAGAASISRRSGHEVSRILQEGLVNVRKHSGARHVLVRAAAAHGRLKLSIEDDGRGFPFSGRLSHSELTAGNQGPAVIMERVRALGGDISVESRPGQGARIEVAVPLQP